MATVYDKMTAIADAIREKTGDTEALTVDDMITAVAEISGSGFPNGTEWTRCTLSPNATRFHGIAYANGVWVVCTGNGSNKGLYYSTDGKIWTQSNITSGNFYGVVNANGMWIATGGADLCYSTDGKTWTSLGKWYGYGCIYFNGIWTTGSYYSTDAITWTKSNIVSGKYYFITDANGILVACDAANRNGISYSTDGMTWTQSNITSGSFYEAVNANGLWVTGCYNGLGLYYSIDGKTWTQSNITSGIFRSVACGNGLWVAGGGDNSTGTYYSTDGKTWTQSNITSGKIEALAYANGIWVGGGSLGLYYSIDGKTWTQININASNSFYDVVNANGIWVISCYGGSLYYSVTWEPS